MANPEQRAIYLTSLFKQLSNVMKDDPTRWIEEDYYRMRLARDLKSPNSGATQSRTPEKSADKTSTSRPCAGHLRKQLILVQMQVRQDLLA